MEGRVLRVLDPCFSYFHHWPPSWSGHFPDWRHVYLFNHSVFYDLFFPRAVHLKPMCLFLLIKWNRKLYVCKDIECNIIHVVTLHGGMSSDNIHLNTCSGNTGAASELSGYRVTRLSNHSRLFSPRWAFSELWFIVRCTSVCATGLFLPLLPLHLPLPNHQLLQPIQPWTVRFTSTIGTTLQWSRARPGPRGVAGHGPRYDEEMDQGICSYNSRCHRMTGVRSSQLIGENYKPIPGLQKIFWSLDGFLLISTDWPFWDYTVKTWSRQY